MTALEAARPSWPVLQNGLNPRVSLSLSLLLMWSAFNFYILVLLLLVFMSQWQLFSMESYREGNAE